MWIGTAFLVLYGCAIWCESTYRPAHIGFGELLTLKRMWGAVQLVQWQHLRDLEVMPMGIVTVAGMIGWLIWNVIRIPLYGHIARLCVTSYVLLLVISGGWMGLLAMPIELLQHPDGETLDEGGVRLLVIGLWTATALAWCIFMWRTKREPNQQIQPIAGEPGSG